MKIKKIWNGLRKGEAEPTILDSQALHYIPTFPINLLENSRQSFLSSKCLQVFVWWADMIYSQVRDKSLTTDSIAQSMKEDIIADTLSVQTEYT